MRFLEVSLGKDVPDAKNIWLFRNIPAKAEAMETLFALFTKELETRAKRLSILSDAALWGVGITRSSDVGLFQKVQGNADPPSSNAPFFIK
jgi:hypothetical protein